MRQPIYLGTSQPPLSMEAWDPSAIDESRTDSVAFFLIESDTDATSRVLEAIRSAGPASIYLKPVVMLGSSSTTPTALQAADAVVDLHSLDDSRIEHLVSQFHPINEWIGSLDDSRRSTDGDSAFRLLRYLASRGEEAAPKMTISSAEGFTYPPLVPLTQGRPGGPSLLEMLDFLETQQLISGRFVTKAHFCGHCGCAFLNFKEVCPDCLSEDIDADELIHHFPCGHVAPISDFETRNGLVCPKCDRGLRHIGVDYDKPSVIFECNSCQNRFQSPHVLSTCFRCERTVDPEQQTLRRLQAWSVTAIGNSTAMHGMDQLFMRVIDTQLDLWSLDALKQFVEVEKARNERYAKSNTSVAVLQFDHLSDMYVKLGKRAQQVFAELAQVLTSVLRRSDIIAPRGDSTFVLVLPETDESQANRALERIEEGVQSLLSGNLEKPPTIHAKAVALTGEMDIDDLIESSFAHHD